MNLLDLLLFVMVAASIFGGFVAGFARLGIGMVAAVVGLLCGFWFYGIPAAWIHRVVHSVTASSLLGFFLVLFGFIFVGGLIGRLLSKLFKWSGLSWLDRLFGGAIGFVRGVLIAVGFVTALVAFTPKPTPNWMVDSKLLPYAIDASNLCAALTPRPIKDAFRESMADIRKAWEDMKQKPRKKESNVKKVEN